MEEFIKFLQNVKKRLEDKYDKIFGKLYQKRLKCKDFTIISNNCFGGNFYRQNAMPYKTPTCGLFFIADEYIKFIYNFDKYISGKLVEIQIDDSKYRDYLKMIKYDGVLGKIDDLEICFLHYKTFKEASTKWYRRAKRINKDKLVFKFSDQNLCTYKHLKKFDEFPAKHKICFTAKKYDDINTIQLKKYRSKIFVQNDSKKSDYRRYFNIYKFLNNCFKK